MTTHRERRAARAERLREWAEKREAKSAAAFGQAQQIGDAIPLGQPILVGHHSERRARRDQDRIGRSMSAGVEHASKADEMAGRADTIDAQLAASIYSDDADATDRLRERIAKLEAERDRIKAYNASCRKGTPDLSVLTDADRASLASIARYAAYQLGKGGAFPTYVLSNLGGNIARNRQRLAELAS